MEQQPAYDYGIVRSYVTWSVIWGVVAVLVGIVISFQLVAPQLNLPPLLTYGRLRPIHTNAGIFGWAIGSFCCSSGSSWSWGWGPAASTWWG